MAVTAPETAPDRRIPGGSEVADPDIRRFDDAGPPSANPRNWVRLRVPMASRSITEVHRSASPLELLFDLTFVIAIARIGSELAHSIAAGQGASRLVPFLQVFFAIWWAWMNFTWFASSYDNDDALYRVLAMVQMAGALLLAAGVPAAFNHGDYGAITYGYLIMRIALVSLWIRAGIECRPGRRTAYRYARGILVLEVLWVLRLVLAEHGVLPAASLLPIFIALAIVEMAVPCWAERHDHTSWHPHHIAERYGLFAIILLGEALLSASSRVPDVLDGTAMNADLVVAAGAGFVVVMELWWLYFIVDPGPGLAHNRNRAFAWGFAQYGVFASLAALSAGLDVVVEEIGGEIAASPTIAGYTVAIPIATFLCLLALVNRPVIGHLALRPAATAAASGVILLLPLGAEVAGNAVVLSGIAVVGALLIIEESIRTTRLEVARESGAGKGSGDRRSDRATEGVPFS